MILQKDEIIDIPENRIKFFGSKGKMLLPSITTVETALNKVSVHQLVTTSILCDYLSTDFNVDGTCPVTTKKAIIALSKDEEKKAPYWRVVNQNGGLVAQFSGGVERQSALLKDEGFEIVDRGKTKKVKNYRNYLVQFGKEVS